MQLIRGQPDWLLSDRQHHEAYSGSTALLKELPLVGQMHLLDALPNAMVPHSHPGIYEVHLVAEGSMGFEVDGQEYEVGSGSVFFTKPDQLHGTSDGSLRPAKWCWIHLHIPREHALPGMACAETRELAKAYGQVVLKTFRSSQQLRECFERLLAEHRDRRAHGQTVARAILHELMVVVLRDHDRALVRAELAPYSAEVQRAVTWLNQHLGDLVSIPDIAKSSGLGPSQFRQRFHSETGFTPLDYLTRQRVLRAKELLRSARASITEIAFRLGFQSSPYFAAVFKKITGITPSDYRAGLAAAD